MFKPEHTTTLDSIGNTIRMGVQGKGGTGKSTAMLTFPNLIVADIDNSVDIENAKAVKVDPTTIYKLKFHDPEFLKASQLSPNIHEASLKWIETNIMKFTPEQTFGLDSWTFLQDHFDVVMGKKIPITSTGAEDGRWFWGEKQDYSQDILTKLKRANCNLYVVFHEVDETDDKGRLTGRVRPMMDGKYNQKLSNHFTYWFRATAIGKKDDASAMKEQAKKMQITDEVLKMLYDFSNNKTVYTWQTQADELCACKSKLPFVKFIPASYEVFRSPEAFLQK